MSVVTLIALSSGKARPIIRASYLKKTAWAILVFASIYWTASIPYIHSYYQYSGNLKYPESISAGEETRYIKDHHSRIEDLERELKEAKEDLRALKEHYWLMFQFIMYGVVFYGCSQIFDKKNKNLEEVQADRIEKL
jgi:hypothetical protein